MKHSLASVCGRLLPAGTTPEAGVLLRARAVRAFGDGFVSVLLPLHLAKRGFDTLQIGAIATATLVGSAALTLFVGLVAHRFPRRALLIRASLLMAATGAGFALIGDFWPLLIVAFVGTLNPSAGDVSVFLPTEQALLSHTSSAAHRTTLFARYNVVGSLVGAFGALSAGLPDIVTNYTPLGLDTALRGMFLLYALLGLAALRLYRDLPPAVETGSSTSGPPLERSKRIVYTLAALFSLDSFAGGFVVQSLLALWLFERFDLSVATAGTIFFWSGLLAALSQLAAPPPCRPDRPHQLHGVHPPAGERLPRARGLHADAAARDRLPASTGRPVADGCPRPPVLRDGGRCSCRAGGGGQCDERASQSRRCRGAPPRRMAIEHVDLRLAAGGRGNRKGHLRPAPAVQVPSCPAYGGNTALARGAGGAAVMIATESHSILDSSSISPRLHRRHRQEWRPFPHHRQVDGVV